MKLHNWKTHAQSDPEWLTADPEYAIQPDVFAGDEFIRGYYCNGPLCLDCNRAVCHHCFPGIYQEECLVDSLF